MDIVELVVVVDVVDSRWSRHGSRPGRCGRRTVVRVDVVDVVDVRVADEVDDIFVGSWRKKLTIPSAQTFSAIDDLARLRHNRRNLTQKSSFTGTFREFSFPGGRG